MQSVTPFNKLLIVGEPSFPAPTEIGFVLTSLCMPTATKPSPCCASFPGSSFRALSDPEHPDLLLPGGTTCSRGGPSSHLVLLHLNISNFSSASQRRRFKRVFKFSRNPQWSGKAGKEQAQDGWMDGQTDKKKPHVFFGQSYVYSYTFPQT